MRATTTLAIQLCVWINYPEKLSSPAGSPSDKSLTPSPSLKQRNSRAFKCFVPSSVRPIQSKPLGNCASDLDHAKSSPGCVLHREELQISGIKNVEIWE
jgi:hypothetical protein